MIIDSVESIDEFSVESTTALDYWVSGLQGFIRGLGGDTGEYAEGSAAQEHAPAEEAVQQALVRCDAETCVCLYKKGRRIGDISFDAFAIFESGNPVKFDHLAYSKLAVRTIINNSTKAATAK